MSETSWYLLYFLGFYTSNLIYKRTWTIKVGPHLQELTWVDFLWSYYFEKSALGEKVDFSQFLHEAHFLSLRYGQFF